MSAVIRWVLDDGGDNEYTFPRNPDRDGGDTWWHKELRFSEINPIGSELPTLYTDGFNGAVRTIKFSVIPGSMMRTLQEFYHRREIIQNCRDHLYPTTTIFSCVMIDFKSYFRPVYGNFPGSYEDTWDVEITLMRMA
jgi:hypothetical protein